MSNISTLDQTELRYADSKSLEDMADFFELNAEMFRQMAFDKRRDMDKQTERAGMMIEALPREVLRHIEKDYVDRSTAIQRVSDEYNLPYKTVEGCYSRFTSRRSAHASRMRNRVIIELAALGFTNAQIGKRVDLHPNSVSRIISSWRKAYRQGLRGGGNVSLLLGGGFITEN